MGWRTIGYVEINPYCQKVLRQRIDEGYLDNAPIFGDIRTFIGEGYADGYKGLVNLVTAGFPCQPFSVAGKKRGKEDSRNLWPETIECIRRIRPEFLFLENVPGLLTNRYIRRIYGELAEIGYNARWLVLGADDVGAPHRRKRWWCLGYTEHSGLHETEIPRSTKKRNRDNKAGENETSKSKGSSWKHEKLADINSDQDVANPHCAGRKEQCRAGAMEKENITIKRESEITWWNIDPADLPETQVKSRLGRVAYGVANRVDRLKAIGNGQVPAVVRRAWELLTRG
jgi:DNA (cytosine-5)-methyltransferase 1